MKEQDLANEQGTLFRYFLTLPLFLLLMIRVSSYVWPEAFPCALTMLQGASAPSVRSTAGSDNAFVLEECAHLPPRSWYVYAIRCPMRLFTWRPLISTFAMAVRRSQIGCRSSVHALSFNCFSPICDEPDICIVCHLTHLPYNNCSYACKRSQTDFTNAKSHACNNARRSLPLQQGRSTPIPSSSSEASSLNSHEPILGAANMKRKSPTPVKEPSEEEPFERPRSPKTLLPPFRYQPPRERRSGKATEGEYRFHHESSPAHSTSCPSVNTSASTWSSGMPCRRLLYDERHFCPELERRSMTSTLKEPKGQVKMQPIDNKCAKWVSDVSPARLSSLSEPCRPKSRLLLNSNEEDETIEEAVRFEKPCSQ